MPAFSTQGHRHLPLPAHTTCFIPADGSGLPFLFMVHSATPHTTSTTRCRAQVWVHSAFLLGYYTTACHSLVEFCLQAGTGTSICLVWMGDLPGFYLERFLGGVPAWAASTIGCSFILGAFCLHFWRMPHLFCHAHLPLPACCYISLRAVLHLLIHCLLHSRYSVHSLGLGSWECKSLNSGMGIHCH